MSTAVRRWGWTSGPAQLSAVYASATRNPQGDRRHGWDDKGQRLVEGDSGQGDRRQAAHEVKESGWGVRDSLKKGRPGRLSQGSGESPSPADVSSQIAGGQTWRPAP